VFFADQYKIRSYSTHSLILLTTYYIPWVDQLFRERFTKNTKDASIGRQADAKNLATSVLKTIGNDLSTCISDFFYVSF